MITEDDLVFLNRVWSTLTISDSEQRELVSGQMSRWLRKIENHTTRLVKADYGDAESFMGEMDVIECCDIGPATERDNYCCKCGRKIIR